ncbi:DJ-1/PfpI family protein [Roseococcus sp.]|uniref:DJ-1/PfpI family protein n=1 Tax=Roseococcus sp. TaxID=2109646 RepID=UPI003BA87AB3
MEEGPLRAQGGFTLTAEHGPELLDQADIIVVPGWKGAAAPVPEALCQRLRDAHGRGARLASICSGAFVLAATGLLDGGTATTHWRYADVLRQRYPGVAVDHGVSVPCPWAHPHLGRERRRDRPADRDCAPGFRAGSGQLRGPTPDHASPPQRRPGAVPGAAGAGQPPRGGRAPCWTGCCAPTWLYRGPCSAWRMTAA